MTDEAEARRLAELALTKFDNDDFVLTSSEEFEVGWVFFWNSRRYLESGSISDALAGNSPILVDRSDSSVHFTGTGRPTEDYVRRYVERDPDDERSWHP